MKYLLTILLVAISFNDLDRIATINKVKKEAKTAFNAGDYKIAAEKYAFLIDSMDVNDDNVRLNLANAYYQLKDTTQALNGYSDLLQSNNKVVKSVAHQQLGVMSNREKKIDEALDHFKDALRANPNNEDARYNYELLKKIKKEQEEQQKQQQDKNKDQDKENKDEQNKDQEQQQNKEQQDKENQEKKEDQEKKDQEQQNKDQKKDGEGEEDQDKKAEQQEEEKEGEEKKEEQKPEEGEENKDQKTPDDKMNSVKDKLEGKLTPEKANMILEAMRGKEIQYLQQNRRKPTKKKDSTKPDW